MALLEIKKFKDPILRGKCKGVKDFDRGLEKLVVDMVQTMEMNNGIGLAAPQIGVLKRVVVLKPDLRKAGILILVNPKIIKKSKEKEAGEEGCLSFPGIFLKIKRSKRVSVEYKDKDENKIKLEADGMLARVLQHEIDHLDGVLFFDRLGFFERIIFKIRNKA